MGPLSRCTRTRAVTRETLLNPGSQGEKKLESKGTYVLRENDVVSFRCSGSGGFGDPKLRAREQVLEDLREGRISQNAARQYYGVEAAEQDDAG